jgi:hypothetical protein
MKYVVLLAAPESDWEAASAAERQQVMDAHTAFHEAVSRRAAMLAGEALADSSRARTLRHREGKPVVTEGPYAEGVEQLGGFYLLEADTEETVLDLCAILPSSYAVEVRPVIEIDGYDDTRDWE